MSASILIAGEQCPFNRNTPDFIVHRSHLVPISFGWQILTQEPWREARDSAFPSNSQGMPMNLVRGPHLEQQ